jgi:hypothetical protein
MEHLFQAKTVQRMELNVLSTLGWRLRSITPFTFLEKAINHLNLTSKLKASLLSRASELLLASLAGNSLSKTTNHPFKFPLLNSSTFEHTYIFFYLDP